MARHVSPAHVSEILVIDNSTRGLSRRHRERLVAGYGPLRSKVTILTANEVAEITSASEGWRSQQVLKLMVAKVVGSDAYVVLDAKNHFVRKFDPKFFSHPDGRLRTRLADYRAHPFRPELERVIEYLDVGNIADVQRFTPTVTPFALSSSSVREMIVNIEATSGVAFEREFERAALLEFFLYGGWILRRDRTFEQTYALGQPYCPIVWRRDAHAAGLTAAVDRSGVAGAPIFSVHRSAFEHLDASARRTLSEFWVDAGLFDTTRQARAFILRFRSTQRVKRLRTAIASRIPVRSRVGSPSRRATSV